MARGGEDRGNDERGDNRGDAPEACSSAGAASANLSGVELWSDGVERAPRAEVEKGQEAAGDNDGYFGLGHAKGAGGYGGADEEDGEGDAAAPYFNQPGGSGVAR